MKKSTTIGLLAISTCIFIFVKPKKRATLPITK